MEMPTLREQLEEIYREAYAAGYSVGYVDGLKGSEFIAQVPWVKTKETKEEAIG